MTRRAAWVHWLTTAAVVVLFAALVVLALLGAGPPDGPAGWVVVGPVLAVAVAYGVALRRTRPAPPTARPPFDPALLATLTALRRGQRPDPSPWLPAALDLARRLRRWWGTYAAAWSGAAWVLVVREQPWPVDPGVLRPIGVVLAVVALVGHAGNARRLVRLDRVEASSPQAVTGSASGLA